jgi:hypothetical protein
MLRYFIQSLDVISAFPRLQFTEPNNTNVLCDINRTKINVIHTSHRLISNSKVRKKVQFMTL